MSIYIGLGKYSNNGLAVGPTTTVILLCLWDLIICDKTPVESMESPIRLEVMKRIFNLFYYLFKNMDMNT